MNTDKKKLKKAVLWKPGENKKVDCRLCSRRCSIAEGQLGVCGVRKNIDGSLYSLNYDKVCAANPDPIEKKPLFHFQPGTRSFSIACAGCNFRCQFCQNWQISQIAIETGRIEGQAISPEQIVSEALSTNCKSIAYTYTEPTIFMELCAECGRLARQNGLANVFVSNGYMTREAIDFVRDFLDGINIDFKSFSQDYYKTLCGVRLQPVLDTIEYIAKNTDIWMELTTLIVPDRNDSDDELKSIAGFIIEKCGPQTPWHISRFHPQYKYLDSQPTPIETLQRAYDIGKAAGLHYIYIGNVPGTQYESTFCHNCGKLLIERTGYSISANYIKNNACPQCSEKVAGVGLS